MFILSTVTDNCRINLHESYVTEVEFKLVCLSYLLALDILEVALVIVGRVSVCVCVVGGEFSFMLSPSSDTCSTVFNTGLVGLAGISRF